MLEAAYHKKVNVQITYVCSTKFVLHNNIVGFDIGQKYANNRTDN